MDHGCHGVSHTFVLLADHMFVDVDGVRRHFVRGDELPPIEDQADIDRLTEAGAIAPKGTKVGPRPFEVPLGSVLPGVPELAAAPAESEPEPTDKPERPKQVAPKAEWVAWAKAVGYDAAEVDELSKADLQALEG